MAHGTPTTAGLLGEVTDTLKRYIVLTNDHQATALGLWVLHTHAFEAADSTPYPLITSPEKRSGKSRLLEVLQLLVSRGWHVSGISEAVLFRKIEKDCPTLLLDEVDAIFGTHAEKTEPIRALINAGNRRGGTVSRCEGPSHDVGDFSVFSPKCLAGIETGKLPETIRDRSIPIRLQRKRDEQVERFRYKKAKREADELAGQLAGWAAERVEHLEQLEPSLPEALNDRAGEGWEPLLAIAEIAGGDWPEKARAAAVALCADGEIEDDSFGVQLLADIRRIWDLEEYGSRLFSHEICEMLKRLEDAPWANWGRNRKVPGFAPVDLAKTLRRYSIKPKSMRVGESNLKGYEFDQFEDSWARYVPEVAGDEEAE
jgi:Protein of unknown function (DUF3631)